MNFNKTTAYSLKVLGFMSKFTNSRMSAKFLHEKLDIPYSYLRQVLGSLNKHGLIDSTKGRGGGFILTRDINNIYLDEIINSSENLDDFNKCIMGFQECPFNNPCPIHNLWSNARDEIRDVLKHTSLADLKENGSIY